MTLRRSAAIALVAIGAKSTSAVAPRSFLSGLLPLDAIYGANKSDKLMGRMQMNSMHDCKREGGD